MEIFKWLDDPNFATSYIIHDFRESTGAYYLNVEVHLINSTVLFVKEFVEISRRKYAFHWQKTSGELLVRWDNAPHFPKLSTFPHHKHVGHETVEDSYDISLEDVFQYIQANLSYSP